MKRIILSLSMIILAISFMAFNIEESSNSEKHHIHPNLNPNTDNMNSFISIFEIPATDISRAINFYQVIMDIEIEKMEFPGMHMGLLPYEDQMVTGIIVQGEGYLPSENGVAIYLNGGEDLQVILDKVENNGGKIIIPKTPHADESGFFAIFLDSEGNKLGLHSPN